MKFIDECVMRCSFLMCLISAVATGRSAAPASPGPYEILPFENAFIIEAFCDLLPASAQIADWTGWTSDEWISPHPYNNHHGTDFSVAKGTPVYAATTGTVVEMVDIYTEVNFAAAYGNYVKIAADGLSPQGEQLTIITAHMQKGILVDDEQEVVAGQLLGYSHTTGNSTTEHVHVESALATGTMVCPFYCGHYKYPIMVNPSGQTQVGHVVRVKVPTTQINANLINTNVVPIVGTAHQDQLYFAAFAKRGYYRVFVPDANSYSAGWIKALDVEEIFTGTVIQALPDSGPYTHLEELDNPYPMYSSPGSSTIVGYIRYGGARFVADEIAPGGWYRIADPALTFPPSSDSGYGWVQVDSNMVVYPELYNPDVDLPAIIAAKTDFPYANDFTETGRLDFGRPKFHWLNVENFTPASPGGDGKALRVTDDGNIGQGAYETVSVGRPDHRDYYVKADVYLNYQPGYGTWERYGIFLRDDGFGGFDQTFEGAGNCYAMTWDSDDGWLRCGKIIDGVVENLPVPAINIASDGWHEMRIEAQGDNIRFYLDGVLRRSMNDTTFISGLCGMGYHGNISTYPAARGGYFDNFIADALPGAAIQDWALY